MPNLVIVLRNWPKTTVINTPWDRIKLNFNVNQFLNWTGQPTMALAFRIVPGNFDAPWTCWTQIASAGKNYKRSLPSNTLVFSLSSFHCHQDFRTIFLEILLRTTKAIQPSPQLNNRLHLNFRLAIDTKIPIPPTFANEAIRYRAQTLFCNQTGF